MTKNDVYESLLNMYCEYFGISSVAETLMPVLRLQFTPQEADLAVKVGLEDIKLDQIQARSGIDRDKLRKMLNTMADKGTMWIDPGVEDPNYRTLGIVAPGILETGGWGGVRFPHSVQLLKVFHDFQLDYAKKVWAEIPSISRVWTTPAALPDNAHPKTNLDKRIEWAGCWGVATCPCRLSHWVVDPGNHCEHMLETCLFLGDIARWGIEHGICREMTYEEAVDFLRKANEDGLIHSGNPKVHICNCCRDCCILHFANRESGGKVVVPSKFIPQIDEQTCIGCGVCADRCQVDAIVVDECAVVDMEKCLGCGVCFPTCPTESVSFVERPEPETT